METVGPRAQKVLSGANLPRSSKAHLKARRMVELLVKGLGPHHPRMLW